MAEQIPSAEQSVAGIVENIHSIAQSHAPMEAMVGLIISPPPDIKIAWNNIILDKKQVYIAEYLLIGYKRTARGHLVSGTQLADCGCGPHEHAIDNGYSETWITTDTLKKGDLVSVLPIKGGQQFIISDKLIYLGDGYRGNEQ